jgi:hypothetical protein
MPFQTSLTDASKPPRLQLRVVSDDAFQLVEGFAYKPTDGSALVDVPRHNPADASDTTDLASVPNMLWGLLASYGRQLRAALMHDRLCDNVDALLRADKSEAARSKAYSDRRRADNLIRMAMRDAGDGGEKDKQLRVSFVRSWLFWAGVSFGRYLKFRRIRLGLLVLQVLAATVMLYVFFRLVSPPWLLANVPGLRWVVAHAPGLPWLEAHLPDFWPSGANAYGVVALILLALSSLWGRDWRIPFVGILAGPILLPAFVTTLIAQVVLWIPDKLLSFVKDEPDAHIGPTFTYFHNEITGLE